MQEQLKEREKEPVAAKIRRMRLQLYCCALFPRKKQIYQTILFYSPVLLQPDRQFDRISLRSMSKETQMMYQDRASPRHKKNCISRQRSGPRIYPGRQFFSAIDPSCPPAALAAQSFLSDRETPRLAPALARQDK
jgi:hypothetical protein